MFFSVMLKFGHYYSEVPHEATWTNRGNIIGFCDYRDKNLTAVLLHEQGRK